MVGTWAAGCLHNIKFSSEYNRCLNRCVAFPAWYNNYLSSLDTRLKFNIAPEKWWLEDHFPSRKVTFQGLC